MIFIPVFINRNAQPASHTITPEEHRTNLAVNEYMRKSSETPREEGEAALKELAKKYGL